MALFKRFSSHIHANTIYDCCYIFCLSLFILGCSGLTKQQDRFYYNRKSIIFMCLAACWYLSSLIACVYLKFQNPQVKNLDSLIKSIIYLEIFMSVFMYLTTVISMLLNINKNLKLYAMVQYLDEKLLKKFACRFNYNKLLKKNCFHLTFVVLVYMTVIISSVSQASNSQEVLVHLLAGLAYTAVTGGPHLNCYAQMNMAEVLSIRFRLLQKLLTKQVVCSSKLSVSQQVESLRSLICFVQEYHNCISQINEVYSVCLVTTMLHGFTLTTSEFYLNLASKKIPMGNILIWFVSVCLILPLYKMTIAPMYCDKSIREGEKCFNIIIESEDWFDSDRDVQVREIISSCMLWRIDNKIEFLCGTMSFNKQVIVVVYSQIFNYLLILTQFRMTQEMGEEIEEQRNEMQEWIGEDII